MIRRIATGLFWVLCLGGVSEALADENPEIFDIQAVQLENDPRFPSNRVEITYRLEASIYCVVSVRISPDGGSTWTVPVQSLSGTGIGKTVYPGNRSILWIAGEDWVGHFSDQMQVELTATMVDPRFSDHGD